MHVSTLHYLAVAALLLKGSCGLAWAQQLPDDASIARQASQQASRTAAAMVRAEQQAQHIQQQHQAVPDIAPSSSAPIPDPAAIAQQLTTPQGSMAPALFVLVSFSMPPPSLERLAHQAALAGGSLVLRGVVDDSLAKTAEMARAIAARHAGVQILIDPTLFRRFAVKQVPTFVLSAMPDGLGSCGKDCSVPAFASVTGDVTLDYALEHLARQRDARFSPTAERCLQKLRAMP